jgi:hypothetical protein
VARAALRRPDVTGSGQGSRELSAGTAARAGLPLPVRASIYAVGALLWASGASWLLLHYFFQQPSAFGPLPNAWQAPLMRIHGLIAVSAVFLIGWMTASHVTARWSSERNRRSGLALGGTTLVLVFSGYALYYLTGSAHAGSGFLHQGIGLLSPVAAIAHWWRNRSRA